MRLQNFIIYFGTGIILLAFLVALIFHKKEKPIYFRYIFSYIILGLLISANTFANNSNIWILNKKIPLLIEQLLIILQLLTFGLFFIKILYKSSMIKKLKWLLFLSTLIQSFLLILVLTTNIEIKPHISSNLFLLIFCLFYLKDLMNNKPTLIIAKSSAFWIVMGIFYSSCIGFPVNSLIPFIPKDQEFINIRLQIFSIANISLIVLYLFIVKSYLCLKHPQNS